MFITERKQDAGPIRIKPVTELIAMSPIVGLNMKPVKHYDQEIA
jgi:hypothetical protein